MQTQRRGVIGTALHVIARKISVPLKDLSKNRFPITTRSQSTNSHQYNYIAFRRLVKMVFQQPLLMKSPWACLDHAMEHGTDIHSILWRISHFIRENMSYMTCFWLRSGSQVPIALHLTQLYRTALSSLSGSWLRLCRTISVSLHLQCRYAPSHPEATRLHAKSYIIASTINYLSLQLCC